jgi:hypothetical protein
MRKRPSVGNQLWVVPLTDPDGYHIEFESPTDVPEETELGGSPRRHTSPSAIWPAPGVFGTTAGSEACRVNGTQSGTKVLSKAWGKTWLSLPRKFRQRSPSLCR